ncbi:ladderlectin-like isoform X2 [Archocentrus centrarchus]|uniref:ladderlectin-like isoform X2 n=1 Tax=Archocentrus centrarchus TaxID=63155 RepID=UPI0011E9C63E|nr:ladderlectin-like isoform X2 [Archocentrus centrarchus]
MNMLTVCALVCTIVALAGSADLPETKAESNETEPMTWDKAEKNCVSLGGHLASVHNFLEYCRLEKLILITTHDEKETWIGGTDAQEEGHWIWSDGTTFQYNNWCPGEPNNGGGLQHCLQMNYSDGKCWDDLSCYEERPSVCARKM